MQVYCSPPGTVKEEVDTEKEGEDGDSGLLDKEVASFDMLVKQRCGFEEDKVTIYGGVVRKILSPMCLVPEGIRYDVRGETHVFDSVTHITTFIAYGDPADVGKWCRGGVMSDFVAMFGEDHGLPMRTKYGDMIGHIPLLIVKPGRFQLRSAHGIKLKKSVESIVHYDLWRPILHAKFSCPSCRDSLLETGTSYLIDRDSSCEEWGGKIAYPEPKHTTSGKCTCRITPAKNCPLTKEHVKQKKTGTRMGGVLSGRNRMGKYLMAIRAEVRLIEGREEHQDGGRAPKKAKKNGSTIML